MIVPTTSSAQNIWKSREDITQTLSLDEDSLKKQEQERRQAHIQKLIPEIQEPIILWDLTQPGASITIDDGYGKESIEYILDLFEKQWVKATFFVIWTNLKLYPDLWKRAIEQWHEICNHTAHHNKYFKTWNEAKRFESELLWWEQAAKEVLWEEYFNRMKKNFPFFRFPWMHWIRVKTYLDILKNHGYIPIWWSHTDNPVNGEVNNGDIYLWHFNNKDTANVRNNLEKILQSGKNPETVSDIITSESYDEPIWWHNVYKKKSEVKK
jgi:peptidoglycan/xylan/chitin deacetylase (PgdA/CDA1 family)